MSKAPNISAFLVLLAIPLITAHAAPTWVRQYAGPVDCRDTIEDMAIDAAGNTYVVGSTNNGSNNDIVIIKYDPAGGQPWGTPVFYDSGNEDYGKAVVVDGSGNFYVCGSTADGFDNTLLLIKYDQSGNRLWVEDFKGVGTAFDSTKPMAVNDSDDVYVTGGLRIDSYEYDYFTMKHNSAGRRLWTSLYNDPANGQDMSVDMALDEAGNIFVTGTCDTNTPLNYDIVTIKYNPDGRQDWLAQYDGPLDGLDEDIPYDITVDDRCNVYVTGTSRGLGNSVDVVTIKYNGAGEQLWVARYDGPDQYNDYGRALAVDRDGNVYVGAISQASGTSFDYVVIKYDTDGSELWVRRYLNVGWDTLIALALDGIGNVYVTGILDDFIDYDIFTVEYDPSGTILWEDRYHSGPDYEDEPTTMTVDWDGNVHIVGSHHKLAPAPALRTDCAFMTLKYQNSGLVSHWNMDEETGIVAHDSAWNHDATLTFEEPVHLAHWAAGPEGWGGALRLDGTDYAAVPNHTDFDITDQITVAAWVKVDAFNSSWASFVSKGEYSWRLQRDGNNNVVEFALGFWQTWSGVFGVTPINDGNWHYLVGTTDGSWEYLYVDGRLDGSHQREAATPTAVQLSGEPIMIGANPHFTDRTHVGSIDDVRIYRRALTDDEITLLYHKGDPKEVPSCTFLPQDFNKDGWVNFLDFARFAEAWLEKTIP